MTTIYTRGDLELLEQPIVAVIGSRNASREGLARARRVGRELALAGVVVMSGLARGIDIHAMEAAHHAHGTLIGVIGTPLGQCYPREHTAMQRYVERDHLLISPWAKGDRPGRKGFVVRNRLMALLSNVTVVVEAGAQSGTRHQVRECIRLGRPVCVLRSLAEAGVRWVDDVLGSPGVHVVCSTEDITRWLEP